MKKKASVATLVTAISLLLAVAFVAWAAVEPSPFRVTLQNTTNTLPSSSPFYNGTMQAGMVQFYYEHGEMEPTLWATQAYPDVAPGQTVTSGTQWETFDHECRVCHGAREPNDEGQLSIRHGELIDVYNMYSFPPGTLGVIDDPGGPPFFYYPVECEPLGETKCGECHTPNIPSHPIFAFASPGVGVGSMTVSSAPVSGGGTAVGGTASVANKTQLLAPWIALTLLMLVTIGVVASRRFRKKFEK